MKTRVALLSFVLVTCVPDGTSVTRYPLSFGSTPTAGLFPVADLMPQNERPPARVGSAPRVPLPRPSPLRYREPEPLVLTPAARLLLTFLEVAPLPVCNTRHPWGSLVANRALTLRDCTGTTPELFFWELDRRGRPCVRRFYL